VHVDGAAAAMRSLEERTAVLIRLLVVCSVGVALVLDVQLARGRGAVLGPLVLATFGYALVLAVAEWRGRRLFPPWLATSIDALLALLACGLTGGADSIMVAILPLVVMTVLTWVLMRFFWESAKSSSSPAPSCSLNRTPMVSTG